MYKNISYAIMGVIMVDEKKMELKKIKILSVVGFFVISIIGTILHFTYELSNGNLIVATFSAVNESVWEHLKIAVMPVFIWTIVELFLLKYRPDNLWIALLSKIITNMVLIVVLFYASLLITKAHNTVISILIFYFSILIGQIIGIKVINMKKVNVNIEEISKYVVIIIFLLFIFFTFLPPKASIFKDEVTQTYGVFKLEY